MKVLPSVVPTDEQLKIISSQEPKIEVIRGAAGSGKTTTAILRLRGLIGIFDSQRRRMKSRTPIRALVLTYNRTLRGYINELVQAQKASGDSVQIEVETFARWAYHLMGCPNVMQESEKNAALLPLANGIALPFDFLVSEVEYVLGRHLPESWPEYLTSQRDGRGTTPRVERPQREQILNQIIRPYTDWKRTNAKLDWSDFEIALAKERKTAPYDIIIADETQDFSANQIRAILNYKADISAVTFIVDSAQRIYRRGFTWKEVGVTLGMHNSHRLSVNYRNTKQIAALAAPLIRDIANTDTDATIPNLAGCRKDGQLPVLAKGRFSNQLAYAIDWIVKNVDLQKDSVAFLHPKGGGWFDATRKGLAGAQLPFVEITQEREWPNGPENIALSTIYSAKGLEFDYVFMLGLNSQVLTHGAESSDDEYLRLRRLLAMGICRARSFVCLGTKIEDASDLLNLLEKGTYAEVVL